MKKLLTVFTLCLLLLSPVRADVLVLVHGYASSAATWEYSGVARVLVANGWQPPGASRVGEKVFYMPELPAKAPLMVQTRILLGFLRQVRAYHPNESIVLVGHSAGGVVARLAILGGNPAAVSQLVTIASPHLGTPRARQGLNVAEDKPFFCPGSGWYAMKSVAGGPRYRYLRDSRGALRDMLPPDYPGLIHWANQQTHPDIRYDAIVRQQGDKLVPAFSQDLNRVPVLQGKARVWLSRSGHALNMHDGELLINILAAR